MQQQAPSRPAPLTDIAPHTTWASLLAPFTAAVTDKWSLISNSVFEIDSHVLAGCRAAITAAEEAVTTAEELALRHWFRRTRVYTRSRGATAS